ncbi:acyltransferase family protein [Actinoplanes regularis]|uniref:Peptidoglycan/LPS O-acetylase OafA/YrhL, contains acyltransferase and SGNH-hydrolase domains n=1 Tax=Actinoplanes regularis TaxID=52697 RepID=A0A238Z4Q5_9ACTN|nr:acyltransferase [Actinoplanes regularis]GIE85816.1 acyltransferase [Actinoplanes regularis]SNR78212.1 Peptidoglycan/LPS O-acetylase OafA/YrhL, contains acyltransferase and SGNH-hydrolase domains [Actinoplanes regularis]
MSFDVAAPPRLPALDALRAVGAAAVVGTHVGIATGWGNSQWGGLVARLDIGVAVFFVLSGFLLFRPFAWAHAHGARRPRAGRYLWRRALRILPAYWLTVAVCLLVIPGNAGASWGEWLRYATLTQFYERGHYHDALGHTWSLTVEVAFYLLLPLLAVLALGSSWRPRRTVVILCVGGVAVSGGWLAAMSTGRMDMGLHIMWLPGLAVWFAAGMAMATLEIVVATGGRSILTEAATAPLTWWALAAGLFVVAGTPLTGPRDLSDPTAAQFGTKLVLFLAISVAVVLPVAFAGPGPVRSALSGPIAGWLGTVSYGLFLWHPLVLILLHPVLTHETLASTLRVYALVVGGALILASLSWYGMEQPLQQLGRRRFTRTRPAPAKEGSSKRRPVPVP